jgi:hypothetical protein
MCVGYTWVKLAMEDALVNINCGCCKQICEGVEIDKNVSVGVEKGASRLANFCFHKKWCARLPNLCRKS